MAGYGVCPCLCQHLLGTGQIIDNPSVRPSQRLGDRNVQEHPVGPPYGIDHRQTIDVADHGKGFATTTAKCQASQNHLVDVVDEELEGKTREHRSARARSICHCRKFRPAGHWLTYPRIGEFSDTVVKAHGSTAWSIGRGVYRPV